MDENAKNYVMLLGGAVLMLIAGHQWRQEIRSSEFRSLLAQNAAKNAEELAYVKRDSREEHAKVRGKVSELESLLPGIAERTEVIIQQLKGIESRLRKLENPMGVPHEQVFKGPKTKHGLDVSVNRLRGKTRNNLASSPFASIDALELPSGWEAHDGLWIQSRGAAWNADAETIIAGQGDGSDNNANAVIFDDVHTAAAISVEFKLLNRDISSSRAKFHTNYTGVYLRYQDPLNFVRVDTLEAYRPAGHQFIRLLLRENGTFRSIQNIPIKNFSPGSLFEKWHSLRVYDSGEDVKVWLDEEVILEAAYKTSVLPGKKGLLSNIATRALFKNLEIKAAS